MSLSVSLIKLGNKIFKPVVHPFNLANDGSKSYAEWQYEKGADTIKCYEGKYKPYMMFEGKEVLDIGCGAAGKTLYYLKQGAERAVGVDIVESYEKEALKLAAKLGCTQNFNFVCASADNLPYPDNSFDTIIMNDAMEHVEHPDKVLDELLRIVRPDGHVYINFPPYGHPFGAHMSDAINTPWIQYLYPEKACIEAYKELVADKPDAKERINLRISCDVTGKEYISYINHMTIARFGKLLRDRNLKPQYYLEMPLRDWMKPLTKIPHVKEAFVRMVVCVLTKPEPEEKEKDDKKQK